MAKLLHNFSKISLRFECSYIFFQGRTEVVKKDADPEWNHELNFGVRVRWYNACRFCYCNSYSQSTVTC